MLYFLIFKGKTGKIIEARQPFGYYSDPTRSCLIVTLNDFEKTQSSFDEFVLKFFTEIGMLVFLSAMIADATILWFL